MFERTLTTVLAAVFSLAGLASFALAQAPNVLKVQDGIVASLSVRNNEAHAIWRFVRRLDAPLEEISGTINGRPLGVPSVEQYPGAEQTTAILALLDLGDPKRADQIERLKLAMLLLAGRKQAHHQIAFAVYGLEPRLLVPGSTNGEELVQLLLKLPPLDQPSNLSGALIRTIRTLESLSADRRAIFVFTDGHNDSTIALDEVRDLAQSTGVSITFLTIRSDRAADASALSQFANSTGGLLIEENAVTDFLREPFALLDSGGRLSFSLAGGKTYFWEFGKPKITVSFRYGGKTLDLTADADVPSASVGEGFAYLVKSPVALGSFGGILALGGLALFFARRRKTAGHASARRGAPVLGGILKQVDTGKAHIVDMPVMRIGRSRTNDIVVDDPTVSREHALLNLAADGTLSIENKSDRELLVNGKGVDKTALADGDVIALGAVKLEFRPVKKVAG